MIHKVASKMTLEIPEIQSCSWRIGTTLKFSFCPPPHILFVTFRQPNDDDAGHVSEDFHSFSRIQTIHHLLEVDNHDKEEWLVSSTMSNRKGNNLVVECRSKFSTQQVKICGWSGRNSSLWFCFNLWSARRNQYIRIQQHLRGFLLVANILQSWKFLESFIQFISFSKSCILPVSSRIVSWSSTNILLAMVSNVENWNIVNSSISLRLMMSITKIPASVTVHEKVNDLVL